MERPRFPARAFALLRGTLPVSVVNDSSLCHPVPIVELRPCILRRLHHHHADTQPIHYTSRLRNATIMSSLWEALMTCVPMDSKIFATSIPS